LFKALSIVRRRITEQANIITIFVTVALSAVLYGWIEGTLYPYYPFKQQFSVFGHFTWYHVVFCSLFFVIAFSLSLSRVLILGRHVAYLFLASLGSVLWGFWIEDMSYFATLYPTAVLQPGVWVEWVLSGFHFVGHWIPWVYVLLCSGGFLLFGGAYVVAKRDPVTFALQTPQKPGRRLQLVLLHVFFLFVFSALVEISNLLAASLTNLNVSLSVLERLSLIGCVVVLIPLVILVVMDHLYSFLTVGGKTVLR
jgi:hypothetical protein